MCLRWRRVLGVRIGTLRSLSRLRVVSLELLLGLKG